MYIHPLDATFMNRAAASTSGGGGSGISSGSKRRKEGGSRDGDNEEGGKWGAAAEEGVLPYAVKPARYEYRRVWCCCYCFTCHWHLTNYIVPLTCGE